MSEIMIGVLELPYHLYWQDDPVARAQHDSVRLEAAARIKKLQDTNCELLIALELLLQEYEDQKSQFGSDYIWKKYESTDDVENARNVIAKAKGETL